MNGRSKGFMNWRLTVRAHESTRRRFFSQNVRCVGVGVGVALPPSGRRNLLILSWHNIA